MVMAVNASIILQFVMLGGDSAAINARLNVKGAKINSSSVSTISIRKLHRDFLEVKFQTCFRFTLSLSKVKHWRKELM